MTNQSAIANFTTKEKFFILESFGEVRTVFCNYDDAYDYCADLEADGDDLFREILSESGDSITSFPQSQRVAA